MLYLLLMIRKTQAESSLLCCCDYGAGFVRYVFTELLLKHFCMLCALFAPWAAACVEAVEARASWTWWKPKPLWLHVYPGPRSCMGALALCWLYYVLACISYSADLFTFSVKSYIRQLYQTLSSKVSRNRQTNLNFTAEINMFSLPLKVLASAAVFVLRNSCTGSGGHWWSLKLGVWQL